MFGEESNKVLWASKVVIGRKMLILGQLKVSFKAFFTESSKQHGNNVNNLWDLSILKQSQNLPEFSLKFNSAETRLHKDGVQNKKMTSRSWSKWVSTCSRSLTGRFRLIHSDLLVSWEFKTGARIMNPSGENNTQSTGLNRYEPMRTDRHLKEKNDPLNPLSFQCNKSVERQSKTKWHQKKTLI